MIGSDADPTGVPPQVVDPIGHIFLLPEIMRLNRFRAPLRPPLAAAVFVIPHQFLLLGVHRDGRLRELEEFLDLGIDVLELRIAVRMRRALAGLAIPLQAVVELMQQFGHQRMAHLMPAAPQFFGQPAHALAGPAQRRLRVATRARLHQLLQIPQQGRILGLSLLAAPAWTANGDLATPPFLRRLLELR